MAGPARPSPELYWALVATFVVYSLAAAYYAATRPVGTWRSPFSWHPFLMILGMVGCAGVSVVTKKRMLIIVVVVFRTNKFFIFIKSSLILSISFSFKKKSRRLYQYQNPCSPSSHFCCSVIRRFICYLFQ